MSSALYENPGRVRFAVAFEAEAATDP